METLSILYLVGAAFVLGTIAGVKLGGRPEQDWRCGTWYWVSRKAPVWLIWSIALLTALLWPAGLMIAIVALTREKSMA